MARARSNTNAPYFWRQLFVGSVSMVMVIKLAGMALVWSPLPQVAHVPVQRKMTSSVSFLENTERRSMDRLRGREIVSPQTVIRRSREARQEILQRRLQGESTPSPNPPTTKMEPEESPHASDASTLLPYYRYWNFTTHQLDLPQEHPITQRNGSNIEQSSLEILQDVLADMGSPNDAIDDTDECFAPQVSSTAALAEEIASIYESQALPSPLLNVGMPKSGSTTLYNFFLCSGIRSSHSQNGAKMMENVNQGSSRPLRETQKSEMQAYMQLDTNYDQCAYPQIQFLDELHQEYPNATLILMMRPVDEWIRSARTWTDLTIRWRDCQLPGLICTGDLDSEGRARCTDENLRHWWCAHVRHIRNFVKHYPSHQLLEFDLYNSAQTSELLSKLFDAKRSCWGHSNVRAMKNTKG